MLSMTAMDVVPENLLQTDNRMPQAQLPQTSPTRLIVPTELRAAHFTSNFSLLDGDGGSWYNYVDPLCRDFYADEFWELTKLGESEKSASLTKKMLVVPLHLHPPSPSDTSATVTPLDDMTPSPSKSKRSMKTSSRSRSRITWKQRTAASSSPAKNGKEIKLWQMDPNKIPDEQGIEKKKVIRAQRSRAFRQNLKMKGKCVDCMRICKNVEEIFCIVSKIIAKRLPSSVGMAG